MKLKNTGHRGSNDRSTGVHGIPPTIPIALERYWKETITRDEAIRRLQNRPLPARLRTRIEKRIPKITEHYLTFTGKAFREYADFGNGTTSLVLLLPMQKLENGFKVFVPALTKQFMGIKAVVYSFRNGTLYENGVAKKMWGYFDQPIEKQLDVAFVRPTGHPGGSPCCNSCEWVHSVLDIHEADFLCCLGCCDMIPPE